MPSTWPRSTTWSPPMVLIRLLQPGEMASRGISWPGLLLCIQRLCMRTSETDFISNGRVPCLGVLGCWLWFPFTSFTGKGRRLEHGASLLRRSRQIGSSIRVVGVAIIKGIRGSMRYVNSISASEKIWFSYKTGEYVSHIGWAAVASRFSTLNQFSLSSRPSGWMCIISRPRLYNIYTTLWNPFRPLAAWN